MNTLFVILLPLSLFAQRPELRDNAVIRDSVTAATAAYAGMLGERTCCELQI